jgi:hypothetical protein
MLMILHHQKLLQARQCDAEPEDQLLVVACAAVELELEVDDVGSAVNVDVDVAEDVGTAVNVDVAEDVGSADDVGSAVNVDVAEDVLIEV